jgi:hypothetical protein
MSATQLRCPACDDCRYLGGVAELAVVLGVERYDVLNWARLYDDFPDPVLTLARGRIWDISTVKAWMQTRERP